MTTFLIILTIILLIIAVVIIARVRNETRIAQTDAVRRENELKAALFDEWVAVRNLLAFIQ